MHQELNIDLNKFINAQNRGYKTALNEIKNGKKDYSLDVVYFSTDKRLRT